MRTKANRSADPSRAFARVVSIVVFPGALSAGLTILLVARLRSVRGGCGALLGRRRPVGASVALLRRASLLRRRVPCRRSGCGCSLHGRALHALRLIVLLDYGIAWLISVVLTLQRVLLFRAGISVSRILLLVCRQRGWRRHGAAIPSVPPAVALLPGVAPVLAPARRRIRTPPAEVHGRLPVIPHRDAQD